MSITPISSSPQGASSDPSAEPVDRKRRREEGRSETIALRALASAAASREPITLRVSFSETASTQEGNGEWRERKTKELEETIPPLFASISLHTVLTQEKISSLLENELTAFVFEKKGYNHQIPEDLIRFKKECAYSIFCIANVFNDLLNEATNKNMQDRVRSIGVIPNIIVNLDTHLDQCFSVDPDDTPDAPSPYNLEILAICKPKIKDLLKEDHTSKIIDKFVERERINQLMLYTSTILTKPTFAHVSKETELTAVEIASLFQNELAQDLFKKKGYRADSEYDLSRFNQECAHSIYSIANIFMDLLNEAKDKVLDGKLPINSTSITNFFIYYLEQKLDTSFRSHPHEELLSWSRYNPEVLAICKPKIQALIQKTDCATIINAFIIHAQSKKRADNQECVIS